MTEHQDMDDHGGGLLDAEKLPRDFRRTGEAPSREEARFLVGSYYRMQEGRIRAGNQIKALEPPGPFLRWYFEQYERVEGELKKLLGWYAASDPVGRWCLAHKGVGPVIAAGLLAHLDIRRAPTCGHFWSLAGLNPDAKWEKGQKRPWNTGLKVLCWKLGESFVKVSNREDAIYGRAWRQRREWEEAKNEAGGNADAAAAKLERAKKPGSRATENQKAHWAQGKLTPAHLNERAKRWTVKLFLSHLQQVWWKHETGEDPVKPYAISYLGHGHLLAPPFGIGEEAGMGESAAQ